MKPKVQLNLLTNSDYLLNRKRKKLQGELQQWFVEMHKLKLLVCFIRVGSALIVSHIRFVAKKHLNQLIVALGT